MPADTIETAILTLVQARGPEKSICPTEAAQALGVENWRGQLNAVRRVAVRMAKEGRLVILRKGKPVVDPSDVKGVIRLRVVP